MLYLIKSAEYLKIGYTDNLDSRLKQYDTHNPNYELLGTQNLSKWHESKLHEMCKEHHAKLEWFYDTQEVRDTFFNWQKIAINKFIEPTKQAFSELFTLFANNFNRAIGTKDRSFLWNLYHSIDYPESKNMIEEINSIITPDNPEFKEIRRNYTYWTNQKRILAHFWNESTKDIEECKILPGYTFSIKYEINDEEVIVKNKFTCTKDEVIYEIK